MVLSRPGVINNSTAGNGNDTWDNQNALFLKVFSGEVLTSFKRECLFDQFVQSRTIQNGRSAQFPVTGRFTAAYHVAGEQVVGQGNMAQNEVVIRIDNILEAAAELYDLDDAKNHYDIRSIYSSELGQAMARTHDKRIARVITQGARIAANAGDLDADLPNNTVDDPFRSGTRVNINEATPSADDYVASVFAAAEALDSKDVSRDNRVLVCTPEAFYTLIQSSRAVNQDWNQQGVNGSYKEGQITKLAGFSIYSSNNIAQGNVTAQAGEQGYVFDGTLRQSTVDMRQTRMLAFQRGAAGVVKLRDISVGSTGNDYNQMYNATLLTSKMAVGVGMLRPECCVEIYNDQD